MAKAFYVDTSVWRDYFEDRRDNIRPLGEFAARFLQDCRAHGCKILYSQLTVDELLQGASKQQSTEAFSGFKECLVFVRLSVVERVEAGKLALERKDTHLADVLHAVMARNNGAVLVARDHGFECLQDLVEIRKPEEIIFD